MPVLKVNFLTVKCNFHILFIVQAAPKKPIDVSGLTVEMCAVTAYIGFCWTVIEIFTLKPKIVKREWARL